MKTHLLTYLMVGVSRSFSPKERPAQNNASGGRSPKLNLLIFILALILLALGQKGYSQTNTWNGGGGNNWSSNGRWSLGHFPTAAEDVIVPDNKTLNVDMAGVCKSFTISSGNSSNTVSITGTNSLTVTNDVNIQAPSVIATKTISVGTGTLSCTNLILANTPLLAAVCSVTASTGTMNVSGSITMNGSTLENAVSFSGAGTLNLGGDMTGGTFTCSTSTVNCNTSSAQTMSGGFTFYNLRVNKSAAANTVNFSVPVIVNNDFTINVGNALLTGTTANYTVTNDVIIAVSGTLINTVDFASTTRVLNVGGTWTNNGGTFTPGTGTVNFNTTTANENIQGTAASQSFYNITQNKSGKQLGIAGSTTTLNIAGTLTLTAGTFAPGNSTINMTGGDWINNGGTFTPGTGTVNFTSTTAAQNIQGTAATQTFNNIVVNKAGQQLNTAGSTATLTFNGSVTITAGTFVAGTATAINVAGNWTNNGTGFTAGSGTVTFNGGSAQTISGSTITTFNNITLNNSNGLSISSVDVNIVGGAGALTFTNGKITTGSNKVIIGTSGTISGAAANKYVYGNLQLGIATGSPTRVFEIGDASVYAPISVVFNNVTVSGNITAYTVGTEHPNILTSTIDESRSVNRYWSIVNSGTTLTNYTPTFNWVAGDVDAGATTANFIIGRRTSSWAYPTMGTRNPTNCTTTLSSFGTYACGEGGAGVPTIATQPIDQSACSGGSISYIAAANNKPNSTVVWEISTNGGTSFSTLTIASPYSVVTTSASGVTTSTLSINPTAVSMDQYSYRAVFTNSRGTVTSFDGLLSLTAAPTANAGAALSAICGSASSAPLGGSVGGSATGGTWSTPSGGTFTPNATTLNATWTPPGGFTGTATLTLTSSGGSCGTATDSKTQVVAGSTAAVTITPSSATICVNAIQSLAASNTETLTTSSGTVNVAIPDNSAAGATNTIAVSGIPTGATVTGVSVTLNVTHTKDQDLIMNLRAPNGNILNLVNAKGGSGANFTNTVINSSSATALSSGSVPFTGTFRPDATNAIGATGQVSNVTTFPSLYSTANGNWVFSARDGAASNTGTINSWSITITYIDPVTWSPVTYLYTNAAATTPYVAGQTYTTVYAKPTVAGTTTYTATATSSGGCTATQTVAVAAGPVVTVTPDYCYGGGYIQLSASSSPAATSWLWSTGATTSSILVNLAGNYTVTATTAGGCISSVTSPIAQELVVNGDFSSGNTGFSSTYGFVNYTSGCMYPEGIYTVGPTPNFTHSYFFGKDHTTNSGNLLIVNGSGSPVSVWQETITVQPNTTYYFSAWAMSLNDAAPFAQLQFDINGSGIGTTAVLPAGPNSTSAPYTWVQFYGSWTSGAGVTSAVVSIKDLQTALGGNDFGLDDISFGTLTSFVNLTSAAGTDNQTVCNNSTITDIVYTIGSGAGGPSVTGLPPGVNWSFTGTTLTISGTPTSTGTYSYTVTTSPCNPVIKTGLITVQDETISLSSAAGTNAQTPCINTAITNITYSVGGQATGATVTGLPTGVTGLFSAGVFTISGTPTAAGTSTYTVTTTGSCGTHATLSGTINVRRQIITRTSAAGTNAQTLCVNTAITNITYSVGGTATGAGVTGLPSGVTGSYASNVFTISGTPTVVGSFSYTVTTTGTCSSVTAGGTITVNGPMVTLTSAVGTDAQSVCASTAITDITYNIGGTATGASISGLPAGVSGSYSLGVYTISGTPTIAGVYSFTITTSGGSCGTTTANGTITALANNTVTLSSAAGTDAQTKCINTAITNITYATTVATGATITGLPTGVSGSWASNVVTISGTPTVAGTSTYTVTLTGGCGSITATGTITVTANNTITLSSAVGTDAQTKCINTAITNITYSTTGATGATFSGLPSGVSGAWAANVVTISGTPTVAGTSTYTVTLTGGCGSITATGTINVTANNTITLTSAVGTDAQTKCINTAITNITYSTTGATGATFSGLPTGVSGAWATNVVTISGTPTVAGTSTYTVTLTGGCGSITATGTITVTANNTITLTSAVGTNAQTKCINTAITNITYSTTGATGATFSGLPTGVSGAWAANVVTISGTPTVAGTSTYTVTLTGGCGSITATGTITVTANNTITLSSAVGTDAQTKCINTAITNITYSTTGATGATFSGLPTGVSGAWAANVVTISGTPTVSGTATYTVTLTGGCGNITATGTITVNVNTVTLSSAVGTDAQTKCINTAITNITYSTTGATGATFSGLPTGVSGAWAANVVTISGTPTVAGTSTYTVTLTGGCGSITATGTITVTANNTVTLTSAVGTNAQTKCINTAITNITYSTTGTTGATFSGLPSGVSGAWAANVVTISGTPTVAGTSTYTVTLTGGCGSITATGTINVTANNTITLTSAVGTDAQTKCINTAITNITYSTTGATGATFSGLPTGVSGAWAANVVTISGTPTVAGTSTYTVTLTGGCGSITATGTITVTANNTITLTSAVGTNAQTKCINTAITSITYSTTGATGATFSGLPTGVSGAWAANVVTISGTPTVAGTATYTVTLTGGCGSITATGTITVTANNTITLSSAVGTDAQTKCINTAITNITYSTTGATGATFSGLPTGVSGAWAANVVTISGTPTVAGTATYTVTLTGGCGSITATGTITVTANNTITLSSAVGTDAQTKCINTAITNITYSTTGATGATFSGLPTGVSGAWAANVVTISGTPTVAGTSTYTVTLTGGCGSITATGTITVTANNTITLTSAVGTNAQTKCINTAITSITYSTTGATGATFSGLPTGVSGAWAANVVTISGTPTVAGTATYTVTLTGGCGSITATGTITVTPNNTITLSSAVGTNAQTKCINTAITNITYSTTGATGATFSGLPTGVSGAWAANVVTISGTPTVAGTATYTVTLTGGCGSITATGTITVTANNTITLSSAVGTDAQTKCINTAITNITYSTTGATGATFSGLPTGVSGAWAANVVTISGTPTVAGTSTYTVTLTGGCGSITATGTITVTANNTITLTSAVGTNAQTKCINTAITSITYSTTGATGATFSGLPTGVSGAWAANVVTISGTPTVAGTATYTVTLTGGCGSITATGTLTVTANNTITLSSAVGTDAQTKCINTAITNITYSTTGATGATFSGLPTGVSGAWAANVVTISGTPTVAGTSTYTVTLTGGCGSITTTGTITVTANNTITLSSVAGTDAQTKCINTAITNITYSTTGATGATFGGLPTGVSGAWAANVATISGTPTVAGTSTYTVTLTGGCGSITATGTITVTANNTITLTSAVGTNAQTKCINTAITNITYSTTGATGATFSGLPTGVSGAWAANVVTISGTPTVAGTSTYTVTLTAGCGAITATGTIIVDANNTATLSSAAGTDAQTICINTAVTNITYAIGGSATGASVSGLPAGVTGSYSAGVYTLSGTATASGTFNYTVTTTGGSCAAAAATGSIIVSPVPVGGTVADVFICYADNGTLTLTGNVGGVVRWETSNDLSSWSNISNNTTLQTFSGLTTTTWYRALVQSGACASPVYSNNAKVGIHNLWTGNVSSDWNTGANWSDGLTPTTSCPDVTIPLLTSPNVYPQLTSGVATVNNIIIYPNATMVVSNASLQVAGTITNNGSLDITHGTLEMNGTGSAQTIAGSVFDTHTIQNLVISNPNGVNLANTNDTLRITGMVSFGANNAVFNTNNNLTLVSNASGTASVGDLTNGGALTGTDVTGNVTVERYIPLHPKAWQFLAVPTRGQSINAAWQEGNSTLANRNPGYGSIITGEMAGAVAAGFDIYTPAGPSMKTYDPATTLWVGVPNTAMQIANKKGYMFFIRGDRNVTAFNQAATTTTMRTTGKLYTLGINAPASSTVLAGKFESIGNPYASAIDFTTLNKPIAPDVDDVFYAWDPLLTNNYLGLGGYQTISAANGWKPIPGGTANYDANTPYPYIQSGQAFFVHATGAGGTISFSESNKVNQYSMANRVTNNSSTMANRQFLRTYLYNASSMLSDGNVVAFDNNFSNNYDANDAIKIANSSENFSIVKGDKYLALEARSPVVSEDTVFYSFGNVRRTAYQFRFKPEHMATGLTAKLVDNFLHTVTPVSMTDTSSFNFSVTTDAGSWAGNRFYLIFDQAPPVAITAISATRNNNIVTVNWRVEHEAGIAQYELQKSTDGNNFSTIMLADPFGNNTSTFSYSGLDQNPGRGTNYYRVKGLKTDGTEIYSAVVRLVPGKDAVITGKNENTGTHTADTKTPEVENTGISVYPNPVVDKILNVQFFNQAKGTYKLELVNKLGQTVFSRTVTVDGISQSESIHLNSNIFPGIYQLKIKSPLSTDSVQQVIIQ